MANNRDDLRRKAYDDKVQHYKDHGWHDDETQEEDQPGDDEAGEKGFNS
jgi:hypothetical protein